MQTAGLHEKKGTIPSKYELEVLQDLRGKVDGMHKHSTIQGAEPVFELST